jgi:hypothetical protein
MVKFPSIFVGYAISGYLDDIYATLVVKLAESNAFNLKELWRDAADFDTLSGKHRMGIKLSRESAGIGEISVYFSPGVTPQEQVIFANYIHAHLQEKCNAVLRLRHYICPRCHRPKGNPQALMEKLLLKKELASVVCDFCDERFNLWDDLEKRFASSELRKEVEGLQADDVIRLDSRRKGKLLTLEVAARISSADQKCFEIPATEDEGIDIEVEFTDSEGHGTGRRIYLQLKSGNSHLRKRKWDGAEVFDIKDQRWVNYWVKQPNPVMLVIGTFSEDDERMGGKEKMEFSDVRWMEIRSLLRKLGDDGKRAVSHIIFEGERMDIVNIRKTRDRILKGASE